MRQREVKNNADEQDGHADLSLVLHSKSHAVREEHIGVALGLVRSSRMPMNLAKRGTRQQRVGGAKDIIE